MFSIFTLWLPLKKINTMEGFLRNTCRSEDPIVSFALGVPGKQGDLEL